MGLARMGCIAMGAEELGGRIPLTQPVNITEKKFTRLAVALAMLQLLCMGHTIARKC